jgi:hypothetical protein
MLMLSCGRLSRRQYQALSDDPLGKHHPEGIAAFYNSAAAKR